MELLCFSEMEQPLKVVVRKGITLYKNPMIHEQFELYFPKLSYFKRISSLRDASLQKLMLTTLWIVISFGIWLVANTTPFEEYDFTKIIALIMFSPLLLWAIYDYRYGLLLTIITTPLLIGPSIPKSFTQGFGDLFTACSILGFLLNTALSRRWPKLWNPNYVWLILIIAAACLSLILSPSSNATVHYGIKYGIAEIIGYCLAFSYMALLVHEIQDKACFLKVLHTTTLALMIVAFYSLIGFMMALICSGGYGSKTILTVNQTIASTFGDPNFFAAYLATITPLLLFAYVKRSQLGLFHYISDFSILCILFFIVASASRAGIIMIMLILVVWFLITRFRKGTRLLSTMMLLILPTINVVWSMPTCLCNDIPHAACRFKWLSNQTDSSIFYQGEKEIKIPESPNNLNAKNFFLMTTKSEGGWGDQTRLQLAVNAINLWLEHPVNGIGVGLMPNYSQAFGKANRAHNVILTIAAEQGILGVLAWLGWVGCLALILWRSKPKIIAYDDPFIYLVLSFVIAFLVSLFSDYYRMLWLWQLSALVITWPLINQDDRVTKTI